MTGYSAVPVNPEAGTNVTVPDPLTVYVPSAVVRVVAVHAGGFSPPAHNFTLAGTKATALKVTSDVGLEADPALSLADGENTTFCPEGA